MKKIINRNHLVNSQFIWREIQEGPDTPVTPRVEATTPIETPKIEAAAAEAGAKGVPTLTAADLPPNPDIQTEVHGIEADVTHVANIIDGDPAVAATVSQPLDTSALNAGLSTIRNQEKGIVMSPEVEAAVQASFETHPFNTEDLTPTEIQAEIEARVLQAKTTAMDTRRLEAGDSGAEPLSETDYLTQLATEHDLDPNTLIIARARNQAGVALGVDQTGAITDPEAYRQELEAFAGNMAEAQAYLAEHADTAENNPLIQARALAILNGADPATIDGSTDTEDATALRNLDRDMSLGDGISTVGRIAGGNTRSLDSMGSGIGSIPLDPADLNSVPPLDQKTYEPASAECQQLFAEAARSNGMPEEWGASEGLHAILKKESGGIVGRLNYTFGPVAERMETDLNDPQFMSWVHQRLQEGATAGDFGIRSTACGLGQCIRANVQAYYPSGFQGIGDPVEEAAGMLGYIKERYGSPDEAHRQYGVHHEGY